jgi:hypothetical protein
MPHKPKATRKPYGAPSFRIVDANTAKAALETKAVPDQSSVELNQSNSKAASSKTTESTRQP